MTYLITGATGFLGHHVLTAWAAQMPECEPIILVRDKATWQAAEVAALWPHASVIEAPLHDGAAIARALGTRSLRGIFHLAAQVHHSRAHSAPMVQANVAGTRALAELALTHRARLVFVSTSGTVGCSLHAADAPDEHAPHCTREVARWPYYLSKIEAEQQLDLPGLDAVIVRPPILLGPHDHKLRATSLTVRYLRQKIPFFLHGGMHLTDVRDAAQAIVRAMQQPNARRVYHLPGAQMTLKQYFERLARVSGVPGPRFQIPYWAALALAHAARGRLMDPVVIEMGHHFWGLSSRYAEELGYRPRPVDETLADTVAWLRQAVPALRGAPR